MIEEIIYTSAEKGLKAGSRGFCTVVSTAGMAINMAERLESMSGYRHAFPLQSPQAILNPINHSHVTMRIGGKLVHVLSRIADAGQDYSGRTNKLAHHLAMDDVSRFVSGPARLMEQSGVLVTSWDGQVRTIAPRNVVGAPMPSSVTLSAWKRVTGDSGWAGWVAEQLSQDKAPVSVIFAAGTETLLLVREVLDLLPPSQRWGVTFSTYFTKLLAGTECQLRFVLDDTPEATALRNDARAKVVDLLRKNPPAIGGALVHQARTELIQLEPSAPSPKLVAKPQASSSKPPVRSAERTTERTPDEDSDTYRMSKPSLPGAVPSRPSLPPRLGDRVFDTPEAPSLRRFEMSGKKKNRTPLIIGAVAVLMLFIGVGVGIGVMGWLSKTSNTSSSPGELAARNGGHRTAHGAPRSTNSAPEAQAGDQPADSNERTQYADPDDSSATVTPLIASDTTDTGTTSNSTESMTMNTGPPLGSADTPPPNAPNRPVKPFEFVEQTPFLNGLGRQLVIEGIVGEKKDSYAIPLSLPTPTPKISISLCPQIANPEVVCSSTPNTRPNLRLDQAWNGLQFSITNPAPEDWVTNSAPKEWRVHCSVPQMTHLCSWTLHEIKGREYTHELRFSWADAAFSAPELRTQSMRYLWCPMMVAIPPQGELIVLCKTFSELPDTDTGGFFRNGLLLAPHDGIAPRQELSIADFDSFETYVRVSHGGRESAVLRLPSIGEERLDGGGLEECQMFVQDGQLLDSVEKLKTDVPFSSLVFNVVKGDPIRLEGRCRIHIPVFQDLSASGTRTNWNKPLDGDHKWWKDPISEYSFTDLPSKISELSENPDDAPKFAFSSWWSCNVTQANGNQAFKRIRDDAKRNEEEIGRWLDELKNYEMLLSDDQKKEKTLTIESWRKVATALQSRLQADRETRCIEFLKDLQELSSMMQSITITVQTVAELPSACGKIAAGCTPPESFQCELPFSILKVAPLVDQISSEETPQ